MTTAARSSASTHGVSAPSLPTTTAPTPTKDICISDTWPDSPVRRTRLSVMQLNNRAFDPMSSW